MPEPLRGEVWQADLGLAGKVRPVIIVSRYDPDAPRALKLYVPITTKNRGSQYEVGLPGVRFLDAGSLANAQGLASLETHRFLRKLGTLAEADFELVLRGIRFALALD